MAAAAVPYLVLAAGTYAGMRGDQIQADRQRSILNRAMEDTDKTNQKATQAVVAEGQKYAGDARAQDMQSREAQIYQQSQNDLAKAGAGGGFVDTAGGAGDVSSDFAKAKADSVLAETNHLSTIARQLSKVRSTGDMLNNEGLRRADLTGQLGDWWSTNTDMSRAAQMDAQDVQAPWWGTVGKLAAAAYGGYYGGQLSGKKTSAAPSNSGEFSRYDRGQINWAG